MKRNRTLRIWGGFLLLLLLLFTFLIWNIFAGSVSLSASEIWRILLGGDVGFTQSLLQPKSTPESEAERLAEAVFGSAANVTKVTAEADGTSDMSTDRMEELYSNILDEMEAGDYLSREDIIGAKEVSVKLRIEVEGVVRDGTALVCVAECQKSWEAVGLQFSWD